MLAVVNGESAALPLLQFVMQTLWEGRDVERRVITRAAYAALGGVAGALASRADQVLAGLSGAEVGTARQILLRLVTTQRTRRVVKRRQLLEGMDAGAAEILERLSAARLVVPRSARGGDADDPELELVHESLINTWARLARWLEEGREDLALRADVGQAAELWQRHGRRAEEAWEGESLRHARRALTTGVAVPEPGARSSCAPARTASAVVAGGGRGILAGVIALLGGLAIASFAVTLAIARKNAQIEDKHREAESSRAGAQLEAAARALAAGDYLAARANLRVALETGDAPLARSLWGRLRRQPLLWQRPASGMVLNRFTPGGLIILGGGTTAGALTLGEPDSGAAVQVLKAPGLAGLAVSDVSADGQLLAVGSSSGEIGLFQVASGAFRLIGHERYWPLVRLSPDGRRLAVTGGDGSAKVFDTADGRALASIGPGREVGALEFSADSKLLVSCSDHGSILVSDATTGATVKTLGAPVSGSVASA